MSGCRIIGNEEKGIVIYALADMAGDDDDPQVRAEAEDLFFYMRTHTVIPADKMKLAYDAIDRHFENALRYHSDDENYLSAILDVRFRIYLHLP